MPQQKRPIEELGRPRETSSGAWLAHVQYRDALGQQRNIYGPNRASRYLAEQDLNCMRLAGAVFKDDREQTLKAMFSEAHRIQVAAEHANDPPGGIQDIAAHAKDIPASQTDDEEPADPEKIFDPEEWWQELQRGAITMADLNKPSEQVPEEDPSEALRNFRPMQGDVEKLLRILALRADPNVLRGTVTPLQNVMTFASADNLDPMRNLLLEHGAMETEEDKQRLKDRRRADVDDSIRRKEFFEDEREYNPWSARDMDF